MINTVKPRALTTGQRARCPVEGRRGGGGEEGGTRARARVLPSASLLPLLPPPSHLPPPSLLLSPPSLLRAACAAPPGSFSNCENSPLHLLPTSWPLQLQSPEHIRPPQPDQAIAANPVLLQLPRHQNANRRCRLLESNNRVAVFNKVIGVGCRPGAPISPAAIKRHIGILAIPQIRKMQEFIQPSARLHQPQRPDPDQQVCGRTKKVGF